MPEYIKDGRSVRTPQKNESKLIHSERERKDRLQASTSIPEQSACGEVAVE